MQISVHAQTRIVRQHGSSLGELEDHVIEEVEDETWDRVLAVMPAHGGGVVLSGDHAEIAAAPEPAHYRRELELRRQRGAAVTALAAHAAANPDDPVALLARVLGFAADPQTRNAPSAPTL